jgi:hypothetical protein
MFVNMKMFQYSTIVIICCFISFLLKLLFTKINDINQVIGMTLSNGSNLTELDIKC